MTDDPRELTDLERVQEVMSRDEPPARLLGCRTVIRLEKVVLRKSACTQEAIWYAEADVESELKNLKGYKIVESETWGRPTLWS